MKEWCLENPYLTAIIAVILGEGLLRLVSRFFRMIMVLSRGFPKAPCMDADGDIVYPKESK